jgi:hypothetical protein
VKISTHIFNATGIIQERMERQIPRFHLNIATDIPTTHSGMKLGELTDDFDK